MRMLVQDCGIVLHRLVWYKIAGSLAINLTSACPCIIVITVINDQQDATMLACLFISNQLYMFRVLYSPIIRST